MQWIFYSAKKQKTDNFTENRERKLLNSSLLTDNNITPKIETVKLSFTVNQFNIRTDNRIKTILVP